MMAVTSILRRSVAPLLAALAGAALLATAAEAAPRKVEGGIQFTYRDRAAKAVSLAGEFNAWSPTANPMTRGGDELWSVVVALEPGEQPYKFVVDGTWFADPENNVTAGEFGNSVVRIGADGDVVEMAATSNTPYSPKIFISGRTIARMQADHDSYFSRLELRRPTFDFDLGFDIRLSEMFRTHVLTNLNPQAEDVQDYRSRLHYKRGSMTFTERNLGIVAFDSEPIGTWDDPARLVGGEGVFDHPFGNRRVGFLATTPAYGLRTEVLYSDNFSPGGTRFEGRLIPGATEMLELAVDRGTNRIFAFEGDARLRSLQMLSVVRLDSVTFALRPGQISKLSSTDVGDNDHGYGFGDGNEDVFAARVRRSFGERLTLGVLGRQDRGFNLGQMAFAEARSESTVRVTYGENQQEWFALGGEAHLRPGRGLDLQFEYLQGARRLDFMDRGRQMDFEVTALGGSGITSYAQVAQTDSIRLPGRHFTLDDATRTIARGSWTFAEDDITLRAGVEVQTHRYPAWSQPPQPLAGLPNGDHPRFENVEFQRALFTDLRDLDNRMVEWRLGWDRNWRHYLGRPVRTRIDVELTRFTYDPRTAWEYQMWFPTGNLWLENGQAIVGADRLTLLGEKQCYRVRPSLEVPIRRAGDVRFQFDGNFTGVKLGLRPRYAESRFRVGFDLVGPLRFTNDLRWVKYDAPALRMARGYLDNHAELEYRFSDDIKVALGFGVDPSILDAVTNEYADIGRQTFLIDRNASGWTAEYDWLSLAPQLSAAESALQNTRRIQVEAVVRF